MARKIKSKREFREDNKGDNKNNNKDNDKTKSNQEFTPAELAARYKKAFDVLFSSVPESTQKKIQQKGFFDKDTQDFAKLVAEIGESKSKI